MAFGDLLQGKDSADVGSQFAFIRQSGRSVKDFALAFGTNAVNGRSAHELEVQRGVLAKELSRDIG